MIDAPADSSHAEELRRRLVAVLVDGGSVVSDGVAAAFLAVPRHAFAPEVPVEEAYANDVVRTKRDGRGVTISSVSAPWLQASMLEQAGLAPGMRCLEVGSGGYNAALMAELVGPTGEVTTVDIDADVADRARRFLDGAGYGRVNVVLADAEGGVAEHAPYDRIVVTVGVWDIPPAWVDQLTNRGRIVVPLRLRGLSRSVALERREDHLVSLSHEMAGFVDLQGVGARQERLVVLHGEDVGLRFDDDQPVEVEALREALLQPRAQVWSGVRFGGMEPFDGLFLWLATRLSNFCLLSRTRTDAARGLVDPASPIGTPTLIRGGSFAYLTFRKVDGPADTFEFGVYAHGPVGQDIAEQVDELVKVWDRDHRHGPGAVIAVYPAGASLERLPNERVLEKRHTAVSISWPSP